MRLLFPVVIVLSGVHFPWFSWFLCSGESLIQRPCSSEHLSSCFAVVPPLFRAIIVFSAQRQLYYRVCSHDWYVAVANTPSRSQEYGYIDGRVEGARDLRIH